MLYWTDHSGGRPLVPNILRFHSTKIYSQTDFDSYREEFRREMDARYLFECERGTNLVGDTHSGSCGYCLVSTEFRSLITDTSPDWPEQQFCACSNRLSCKERALAHCISSVVGLETWKKTLFLGEVDRVAHAFRGSGDFIHARALVSCPDGLLAVPGSSTGEVAKECDFHTVVSCDYLADTPRWKDALGAIRRVMMPGASFVFTVPFSVSLPVSELLTGTTAHDLLSPPRHVFGWDLMGAAKEVGFADICAHLFWSAELGYLGSCNLLFHASA
jgi:hypothetical protein